MLKNVTGLAFLEKSAIIEHVHNKKGVPL